MIAATSDETTSTYDFSGGDYKFFTLKTLRLYGYLENRDYLCRVKGLKLLLKETKVAVINGHPFYFICMADGLSNKLLHLYIMNGRMTQGRLAEDLALEWLQKQGMELREREWSQNTRDRPDNGEQGFSPHRGGQIVEISLLLLRSSR